MYRILIADDEGIMVNSLTTIISRNFPDCEVVTAKSGRTAVEQAEYTHPDIVMMDIQMPGINGIQAMKEIRKFNQTALFYVISAYDKFDYAKEAIDMGVEKYLTKPISKKTVIDVITEACSKVDDMRQRRSDQLKVQEKLETVIPVVENGFVSNMLISSDWQEAGYFKQLLDIPEDNGYVIVFQFGSQIQESGQLVSPVGMSVQAQSFYPELRAVIKSYLRCVIGGIISDKVAVVVPRREEQLGYEERIAVIENVREVVARLEERLLVRFRAGIGRVRKFEEIRASYQEADRALREGSSQVVHTNDVTGGGVYEDEFPIDLEHSLFQALSRGDREQMRLLANRFFDWMIETYPDSTDNIRLKVLEYVLNAEKDAFHEGAINYSFSVRENYLTDVMAIDDYEQLRTWFLEKMTQACDHIHNRIGTQSETVVTKAKAYIQEHYSQDISLDEVSREVNVSPYYFSKLFKEEAGQNFIEYLTGIRISRAKELLEDPDRSIKQISLDVGYTDPNYFSRIFKKQTQMSPREYRESIG